MKTPILTALRPHVSTGLAVVGAALVAVAPAAPQLASPGQQLGTVQQRALTLTTAPGDPISPYADLLTNTANNLAYLGVHALNFPVLTQFFNDPTGSLSHLPDALILLNTLLPSIDVVSAGLPIQLDIGMTPPLDTLLGLIGPFATVGNAVGEITSQVTDFSNPIGAISALLGAPATLADAFLNGTGGLDVAGFHAPIFNGLLVGPQALNHDFTIGQLVSLAGFGDQTIGQLAEQAGIADQSLAGLAIGLLDFAGVGNPTIAGLAEQFGLSQQSLADLLINVLSMVGVDNPTITDLADQIGLGNQSLASLLSEVLNLTGMGTDQSMSDLALMLLNAAGMGNDPSLGELAITALNAMGMGDVTITGLVQQLGLGDLTLGEVAKQLVTQVAGGASTVTGLLQAVGMGDMTLGDIVTQVLDGTGIGQQTPLDLFNSMFNPGGGAGPTLSEFVVSLLQTTDADGSNMDYTLSQLLTLVPNPEDPGQTFADMTLGQLLQMAQVTEDVVATDPTLAPYLGDSFAEVPWDVFLASNLTGGMGAETFKQLAEEQMGMQLSDFECGAMKTLFAPLDCDRTLSSYMGTNNVYDTLANLKADGHGIAGVPAGTALTDVNLSQLVGATGEGDLHLSSIVLNLNMDTPMDTILTNLGLDNVTVSEIFTTGFPWLANTGVISLLGAWGLDNLTVDTVIDRLGLDMTVTAMLNSLGLDQVTLSQVVDQLLGGMHVSTILTELGLDDVTLGAFLDNLLGRVYVNDILSDLGLADVHLNDVITSLLGGVYVGDILSDLGLADVHLNDVVTSLLGGTTVGSVLDDLGVSTATVDTVLNSLGLTDVDVFGLSVGDFYGLLPALVLGIPQQLADALAG